MLPLLTPTRPRFLLAFMKIGLARWAACVGLACAAMIPSAGVAQDLTRLQGLLASTPVGGWIKVNTGLYSDAWPTGTVGVPDQPNGPGAIVYSWSGFAWDSNRGELLLWGGGHANYRGNEIYRWEADTGAWARGSLPSNLVGSYVIDSAAPQAAHTYDGNTFLPVNDLFITFGGPTWNSGERFVILVNGVEVNAGPWMWDPRKADANKVGGTNGSGYEPTSLGGNMWTNRQGQWTGTEGPYSPGFAAAYRTEAGKDVVYMTMDSWTSGLPALMKYTLGDVRNGGLDKWEWIGATSNSNIGQGAAALDSRHNLLARTASNGTLSDLAVWDLSKANVANPYANLDVAVNLIQSDGTPFVMNTWEGMDYDDVNDQFVLWDGKAQGKVWATKPTFNPDGTIASTWIVTPLLSTTTAQPVGNFATGVLGKWKYIPELDAFMALDELDANKDAGVWLYKPLAAAVPEPDAWAMWASGLMLLAWLGRRGSLRAR